MNSGGSGSSTLARESRRDAESPQPHLTRCSVGHHVGGFDVLVDEAATVQVAKGCRQTGTDAQDLGSRDRRACSLRQRLAAWILEDERGPPVMHRERESTNCPEGIQLVPQRVFVLELLQGLRSRML